MPTTWPADSGVPRFSRIILRSDSVVSKESSLIRGAAVQLPRIKWIGAMRFLFYTALSLVCAVVAAASFIFVALPAGFARDQVVAAVRAKTGRDLHVAGPVTVSFYPTASVVLHDASLSLPDVMSGDSFVKMERLELEMPLLPLFFREVRIARFVLIRPRLNLMVDKKGRRSWDFAGQVPVSASAPVSSGLRGSVPDGSKTAAAADTADAEETVPGPSAAGLEGVSLGELRIEDGTIAYFDELSGSRQRIENIDARVHMAAIQSPVTAEGSLEWNKEALPFTLEIGSLKDIIERRPATLLAGLRGLHGDITFKGNASFTDAIALTGVVDAEATSLSALAEWLGKPVPKLAGLAAATIVARISYQGRKVALDEAQVSLGDATATGSLALDLAGRKPMVQADLKVDRLDLTTYLAKPAGLAKVAGKTADKSADPLDGLVARVNAEVGGGKTAEDPAGVTGTVYDTGGEPWSAESMDLTGLSALNADVKIAFSSFKAGALETGPGKLTANLKERLLKTKLMDVAAFGGKAGAALTVDARQKEPRLEGNIVLRRAELGDVFEASTGSSNLEGPGEIVLSGMSTGASPRKLVMGLMGQGRIDMGRGAIIGIDIAQMFDDLQQGKLAGWRRDPGARTDFDALSASFSITKGKFASDDLSMTGRRLTMTGAGTVDLPSQTVNYGARPVLYAAPVDGAPPRGIEIPVRVTGPWAAPAFAPDLGRIVRNLILDPATALDAASGALSHVQQGAKLKEAIGKLTGGSQANDFAATVTTLAGGTSAEGATPQAPTVADGKPSLIEQLIQQQKQQSIIGAAQ